MNDLVERLRGMAERDTAMSEFGPDEHIAGIAADRIEELEGALQRLGVWYHNWDDASLEIETILKALK